MVSDKNYTANSNQVFHSEATIYFQASPKLMLIIVRDKTICFYLFPFVLTPIMKFSKYQVILIKEKKSYSEKWNGIQYFNSIKICRLNESNCAIRVPVEELMAFSKTILKAFACIYFYYSLIEWNIVTIFLCMELIATQ